MGNVKQNPDVQKAVNDLKVAQERLRSAQVRVSRSLPTAKSKQIIGNINGIRKFANTIEMEVQKHVG
jgi:hypothetical protein